MRRVRPQLGGQPLSSRGGRRLARLIPMPRRVATVFALAALSALGFSACGDQSALALAQQACGKVHASVVSYDAGTQASNPSTKARDLKKAENDLQEAEPLAAQATSADGQWNALMTTLNEICLLYTSTGSGEPVTSDRVGISPRSAALASTSATGYAWRWI